MGKNKLNIEKLYQSQFDGFNVEPSHTVWGTVQQKLFWKQFLSFSLNSFNVYYLLAGLAAPVAVATVLLTQNPSIDTNLENVSGQPQQTTDEAVVLTDSDQLIKTLDQDATYQNIENESNQVSTKAVTEKTKKSELLKRPDTKTVPDATVKDTTEEVILLQQTELEQESEEIKSTVAFTASVLSGCAPLAITFINESDNSESNLWSFGDGGTSTEVNPSYVFDEPGQFIVKLQTMGEDGITRTESVDIGVFETPKAVFEFDEEVDIASGQPVNFYNYSKNADYYQWNFGDDNMSSLSDPVHYFEGTGSFDIKLKVWTANQCFDSLIVSNAFADQGYSIAFPTAFAPNPDGPTGGYYIENGTTNEVFHPAVNGEIIEYQLKIFSQTGRLLFESNDINIGWDGYFQEELMRQNVYIWKARGKFENGKTFVQSGDITLIRQR